MTSVQTKLTFNDSEESTNETLETQDPEEVTTESYYYSEDNILDDLSTVQSNDGILVMHMNSPELFLHFFK